MTEIIIPHRSEPLTEEEFRIATEEMRGWMELVTSTIQVDIIDLTDTSLTTQGSGIIICNNTTPAIITLNLNPANRENVTIKRRDALVTYNGAVDGSSSANLSSTYDSVRLIYTDVAGEWSKI